MQHISRTDATDSSLLQSLWKWHALENLPYVSVEYYYSIFKSISSFDGENYFQVEDSKYSHDGTLGLGNYRGKAFTTGCQYYGCTSKIATELLDMTTMKWSDGPDYPFAPSS